MKKSMLVVLVVLMVFSIVGVAFAATTIVYPSITINPATVCVGEQFTLTATTFRHAPNVQDYWTDWDSVVHSGLRTQVAVDPLDPAKGNNYVNNVTLTAPSVAGTYTVSYYIRMWTPSGNEWIGDEDYNVVVTQIIQVENPAAPAVAAALLKQAGVSPNYGKGKTGGNYISDVARFMSPGTDFAGVSKDDVAAYKAAVDAFLKASGAY